MRIIRTYNQSNYSPREFVRWVEDNNLTLYLTQEADKYIVILKNVWNSCGTQVERTENARIDTPYRGVGHTERWAIYILGNDILGNNVVFFGLGRKPYKIRGTW